MNKKETLFVNVLKSNIEGMEISIFEFHIFYPSILIKAHV